MLLTSKDISSAFFSPQTLLILRPLLDMVIFSVQSKAIFNCFPLFLFGIQISVGFRIVKLNLRANFPFCSPSSKSLGMIQFISLTGTFTPLSFD